MSSRFVPVTDPDKAWEYRQAGVLYWMSPLLYRWVLTNCDGVHRGLQASMMYDDGYQYATLVEDDAESTQCEGA